MPHLSDEFILHSSLVCRRYQHRTLDTTGDLYCRLQDYDMRSCATGDLASAIMVQTLQQDTHNPYRAAILNPNKIMVWVRFRSKLEYL